MSDHTENASKQADAQLASIVEMVSALSCDYDRLDELRGEKAAHDSDESETICWAEAYPEDAEELLELEAAAGDCADYEDAERRIHEDALSVEVRSDWTTLADACADGMMAVGANEFRILLCTGGPAVQIRGTLDDGEPERAWLEYQDWGTPWTERVNQPGDQLALLTYARAFYFGQ